MTLDAAAAAASAAPPLRASAPSERLLCCNVLTSDENSEPQIFRNPFYSYDGPITWPPPRWKEGRCLYCVHPFDRPEKPESEARVFVPPVPLPCFHDKRTNEWRVSGMYCSWNCAKAELLSMQGYACGGGALLLDQLARTVFDYAGGDIAPAPPRARLAYFYPAADALDIDTFRHESAVSFTTTLRQPLLSSPEIYERHALSAGCTPWSVKGIRAKTGSATGGGGGIRSAEAAAAASASASACANNQDAGPSLFNAFVKQKRTGGDGNTTASAADEKPRGHEGGGGSGGGTLMDWKDAKASPSTIGTLG